jgi:ATP-binding cassette subfamily B protein
MESIQHLGPDYTVLIIAHRLTTLKDCSLIVKLNKGQIEAVGSYEQIVLPLIVNI